MTPEEAFKRLEAAIMPLREHFDAVQILSTWTENGICYSRYYGSGNWYARTGLAHEFLEQDQAQTLGKEISEQLPQPPEDDAENWKQP
jgi:hypothetical protein